MDCFEIDEQPKDLLTELKSLLETSDYVSRPVTDLSRDFIKLQL